MQPPEGWMWWIFSVVLAGSVVGIASNLASNRLQKFLDGHFEQRRKRRMESSEFDALYVKEMVKLAETDATVLTVMANLVDVWQARAERMLTLGYTIIIGAIVMFATVPDGAHWLLASSRVISLVLFMIGVFALISGSETQKKGEIYSEVIFTYHTKHHLKADDFSE